MRTIRLLVCALTLTTLLAVPANAGVNLHVAVDDFFYSPTPKTVNASVNQFSVGFDNGGSFTHTATDVNGMFDTSFIGSGVSEFIYLNGAGSYPYHCTLHEGMSGMLRMKPTASAASIVVGGNVTIRVGADFLKGAIFDVQRSRNDGAWKTVRTDSSDPTPTFVLNQTGTYRFRSRIQWPSAQSDWSPARKVTVTAA
jgi:plastocyanin